MFGYNVTLNQDSHLPSDVLKEPSSPERGAVSDWGGGRAREGADARAAAAAVLILTAPGLAT